jgi:transcriptional regulator with XRE-family HTH domain|tara:strand:+ start:6799 stop:7083 length:285 start_codon:yes stop_codon:yes gene_type:complete
MTTTHHTELEQAITFSMVLRRIRQFKGYSARELSAKAGLAEGHVGKIEAHYKNNVTRQTMQRLLIALHPLAKSDELVLRAFIINEELKSRNTRR